MSSLQKPAGMTDLWIHAETPSEDTIRKLCASYGLSERWVRDALDRGEIPRLEVKGRYTYILIRFAYETADGYIRTAPILFALSQDRLFTVSLEKLPSLSEILTQNEASNTTDPALIMMLILEYIDAQYDRFIHTSSKEVAHLLNRVGKRSIGPDTLVRFIHIEYDMDNFLNSLVPTNTTLRHLLANDDRTLKHHRDAVNTVILNNEQSIQACESNLKLLASIRRTYTLISSHSLDRTIKILTMVSVFISIPTMFFSMYGMNIGLPGQHNRQAFAGLMGLCLVIVLTAYAIGHKKRIF